MQYRFGPAVEPAGTTFRLWAPSQHAVQLLLEGEAPRKMQRDSDGFWNLFCEGVGASARYQFLIGKDLVVPDPASRQQAEDAGGWSVVRAPLDRPTHPGPLRPWHESVICEIHIGTASPEGTFAGLMKRLQHFRDIGYTALELMPINEFPGTRNWGYDGTLIFAPEHSYGTPEEFRALVDRTHELGLCVVLDVVYNHFGSTENFVPHYAPEFFDRKVKTPWGPGINFNEPMVRQFFYENACWWLSEFDLDGLRFDAVHEFATKSRDLFLGELAKAARAVKPDAKLIIENADNSAHWLTRDDTGAPVDFTAQWSDDFHHVVHYLLSGEKKQGYDDPDRDPIADLEKALADGFVRDGDGKDESDGKTRNEPGSRLPMEAFVAYVQNHDQIGNRADGKCISDRLDPARLDFGHFLTLLSPHIPFMFMGEEAHLRCDFPFFFDLPEPDATEKREDRYRQLREIFEEPVDDGGLPDPNDLATFLEAKLDWAALVRPEQRKAMDRIRELIALRRELVWPLTASRCLGSWSARQGDGIIVTWHYDAGYYNMALNPTRGAIELSVALHGSSATTGRVDCHGDRMSFGPWSAIAWRN